MAEVEGASFGRHAAQLLPTLGSILEHAAALDVQLAEQEGEQEGGDVEDAAVQGGAPGWQEAYYTLVLLQKVGRPEMTHLKLVSRIAWLARGLLGAGTAAECGHAPTPVVE